MLGMARKSPLKCSFCGKSEKEVTRLIGGGNPKHASVHICDACVGTCNKILDATPANFTGWEMMKDEELLAGLKTAEATVEATRSVLQTMIGELRRRSVSWESIGKALGISRQAAWERFS